MAEICPAARIERLLLAADGSEYSEGAVREAIKLAKRCGSLLTAIAVIETNPEFDALAPQIVEKKQRTARESLQAVKERAGRDDVACETVVREGEDAYHAIVDEANRNNSSLIVMGRRGRTGLKRLVMGSVTSRVIGHAPCNVLVVPKAAELKFGSIVVATDGSKYSIAAAGEAIGLAQRNSGILTVVGAVPSELMTPTDIDFTMSQKELIAEKEMHEAEKNVKTVKEAAVKAGVDAKAFVMTGRPADAIIEIAKDKNADLIVLGSHGRTGVERLLMGSVAERVIVMASCSVLVVKTK